MEERARRKAVEEENEQVSSVGVADSLGLAILNSVWWSRHLYIYYIRACRAATWAIGSAADYASQAVTPLLTVGGTANS